MCSEYSISLHLIWAIKIPGFKPHQLLDQHQTHFCLDKFVICWRRNTHIFSHPYDDSFLNGCYQNAFLRFLLPHIFSRTLTMSVLCTFSLLCNNVDSQPDRIYLILRIIVTTRQCDRFSIVLQMLQCCSFCTGTFFSSSNIGLLHSVWSPHMLWPNRSIHAFRMWC